MAMKKHDRKQAYSEIIQLMLKGDNKSAFYKLTKMCSTDTGLFIIVDYNKETDKHKNN